MPALLLKEIEELVSEFPERMFYLFNSEQGKHAMYCYEGLHGLAVFSSKEAAVSAGLGLAPLFFVPIEAGLDDARDVAKKKGVHVTCLALVDDPGAPLIHYVR